MAKPKASAADDKEKPAKSTPQERHLQALTVRAERLQHKIDNRIPNFPERQQKPSLEAAQTQLDQVKALIAKARKTS